VLAAGHLWQAGLAFGLVLGAAVVLRRAPARVIHALWVAALIKLIVATPVLAWLGERMLALRGGLPQTPLVGHRAVTAVVAVLDPIHVSGTLPSRSLAVALGALTLLWLATTLITLWHTVRACLSMRTAGRSGMAIPTLPERDRRVLERAMEGTSIPHSRIRIGGDAPAPWVGGFFRPLIWIPVGFWRSRPTQEMRALLLHEDAHRKRLDPLRGLVVSLCLAPYRLVPLVCLIRRHLQQSSEMICDEHVLRQGVPPDVYARALARAVRDGLSVADSRMLSASATGPALRTRLERVQTPWRYSVMLRHKAILTALVAIIAGIGVLPIPALTGCSPQQDTITEAESRQAPARDLTHRNDEPESTPGSPADADSSGAAGALEEADEFPVVQHMSAPVYPEDARQKRIEGTVRLRGLVNRAGEVVDVVVIDSVYPSLDQAAVEALRNARLTPAKKNGKPVEVWVAIPFKFSLD